MKYNMMKAFVLLLVGATHEVAAFSSAQMKSPRTVSSISNVQLLDTATAAVDDSERIGVRASLAEEFALNDGFHQPLKLDLMADEFVFLGAVIGPLNKRDYMGTVGTFKVYEAFPDIEVNVAPFTQDAENPDRFWSVIRVTGTHTGVLDMGSQKIDPTYLGLRVPPQAVSVTFDENDKIKSFTGGYVTDVRDGETGGMGALFGVLKSIRVPAPRPGGKTFKFLNWVGSKMVDFPKAKSHSLDLPKEWAEYGRKHGKRTADAWTT